MEEKIDTQRAAVVALVTRDDDPADVEVSLDELERLLDTAGGESVFRLVQSRETPDVRTYIGKGKVEELKAACKNEDITLVVVDTELSPSKIRNLEDELNDDDGDGHIRVIDRSMLILDIFALHAASAEGKLQVELAQLKYTVPRLTGKGSSMSRQQGGNIAMRGPGESKLESDKRHVNRRIYALEQELREIDEKRATQRKQRDKSGIVKVAIAGYTNVGKSTLLNRLTDAGILAEDKLFATLDTTTRKFKLPSGVEILLIDTVGFIRNLPHHLIKAFKSTLDEVAFADIVMVMSDASDSECMNTLKVSEELLHDIGAADKPTLYVFNKCDTTENHVAFSIDGVDRKNCVYISAATGAGTDRLVSRLEELIAERTSDMVFRIPLSDADVVGKLYRFATVTSVEYGEEYVTVCAICDARAKGMFEKWAAR